ncbi:MAG: hypothetical protein DCC75_09385, partial [Proteobacteria bacterium]
FSNRSSPLKSVHQIAAEVNIPIIELAHYFRRDFMGKKKKTRTSNRKASPRWIYTQGDGTHPNEHAAQLAAEFVKRKIL